MGLDIYLYRYENFADTRQREEEYNARCETIYDEIKGGREYGQLTEEEKDEAHRRCVAMAASLGLDEWGDDETMKHKIEIDSPTYPDHMNKIGYLRSSYNPGGFNSVLRTMLGIDGFDWIFDKENDEYIFQPDWAAARNRAGELLARFRAHVAEHGSYRVMEEHHMLYPGVPVVSSPEAALGVFNAERTRYRAQERDPIFGGSYSSNKGVFFLDEPVRLAGVVMGVSRWSRQEPAVYLVYEADDLSWYEQTIVIVQEFCEWVMAQPEREQYYLLWSG